LQSPSAPIKVYLLSGDEQTQQQGEVEQPQAIAQPEYDQGDIEGMHGMQQPMLDEQQSDPDFIYGLENEGISDLYGAFNF
jgi:hypothetical protein